MTKTKLLTSGMAARHLDFTSSYIRRLCKLGVIKADKLGKDWVIEESALKNIKRQRKKFKHHKDI